MEKVSKPRRGACSCKWVSLKVYLPKYFLTHKIPCSSNPVTSDPEIKRGGQLTSSSEKAPKTCRALPCLLCPFPRASLEFNQSPPNIRCSKEILRLARWLSGYRHWLPSPTNSDPWDPEGPTREEKRQLSNCPLTCQHAHTCACTHERKVVRHILVGFQACSSPQRHPRQPENWGRQTTPTSTYRLLVPPADSITTQVGGGLPILLKGSYVQALKNAQVRATAHRCPRH